MTRTRWALRSLAGEAYADSAVVDLVVKAITRQKTPFPMRRQVRHSMTPSLVAGNHPSKEAAFHAGHAAGAFAVATVVATRYHTHRWVPWVVYGFAQGNHRTIQ